MDAVFTAACARSDVRAPSDVCAEYFFQKPLLGNADFRKAFDDRANGAIMLAECRFGSVGRLGHVSERREQLRKVVGPLAQRQQRQFWFRLFGYISPPLSEQVDDAVAAELLTNEFEDLVERVVVSSWEEPLSRFGERVGEDRSSHASDFAAIADNALSFKFLEVPSERIGRDAKLRAKLLGCTRLRLLESEQNIAPQATETGNRK